MRKVEVLISHSLFAFLNQCGIVGHVTGWGGEGHDYVVSYWPSPCFLHFCTLSLPGKAQ